MTFIGELAQSGKLYFVWKYELLCVFLFILFYLVTSMFEMIQLSLVLDVMSCYSCIWFMWSSQSFNTNWQVVFSIYHQPHSLFGSGLNECFISYLTGLRNVHTMTDRIVVMQMEIRPALFQHGSSSQSVSADLQMRFFDYWQRMCGLASRSTCKVL